MAKARPDAVVVGLGAAGGVVAGRLAEAGLRVLALEKGPEHGPRDVLLKHDEIRHFVRGELLPRMETDPITWRESPRRRAVVLPWATTLYPLADPFHVPPSLGVGGGSVHWTAVSRRFRESDFRMRSTIVERFGAGALPPETTVADWPIGYEELEPYYDRVEWELGVAGQAGNVGGELVEGGNPFEAPRARGYPMPPLRRGAADGLFAAASERLGYHPFPQPTAIASVPYGGRAACVYCGFCHGYPCHVGAKSSTAVTTIPAGLATGNLELRTGARVLRVERDDSGRRVRGVVYVDADRRRVEVASDVVVLACYALENARLLLVSGVNGNGEVGRHYMTHNYGQLTGLLDEPTNPFVGPQAASSTFDDVASELLPDNDAGVVWGSPVISVPGDFQPIEAAHMRPREVPRWGRPLKEWLRTSFARLYAMCSQTANFPSPAAYCDLDPDVRDAWGEPALRITHGWTDYDRRAAELMMTVKRRVAEEMGVVESWEALAAPHYHVSNHEAGVHRMGDDPATSVVDSFGACHECAGLYALGGGQFPSYGGYNPTETIQALAYRAAERIAS